MLSSLILTGCTGIISGHKYTLDDAVVVYKVTKAGVTTFMTKEEISDKGLDKANDVIIEAYKLMGNDAE